MDTVKDKIIISSFNCNGLRDIKKRSVFNWLKAKHSRIILLQETYSQDTDEKKLGIRLGRKNNFLTRNESEQRSSCFTSSNFS